MMYAIIKGNLIKGRKTNDGFINVHRLYLLWILKGKGINQETSIRDHKRALHMACVFYLLDSCPFLYIKRGPIFHFIEEGH